MMKGLYTVRDESSTLYMDVQTSLNHKVAIRNFDVAMSHNDLMSFRPEDFSLWYLGEYDDTSGIINPVSPQIIKRGAKKGAKREMREI